MTTTMNAESRPGRTAGLGFLSAVFLLGVGLVSGPAPLAAQEDVRWAPFLGCWEPAPGFAGPSVCVTPRDGGVELISVARDQVVERRFLHGDGLPREVEEEGCVGTETAAFSGDQSRVYIRSTVACDGGVQQSTTGMLAMVSPDEWVDVNVLDREGRKATWIQRFRSGAEEAAEVAGVEPTSPDRARGVRMARLAALARPSVDEVIEASQAVDPEVVQAWLAERGEPLSLDAAGLIRMADAGVPDALIDVVVAVSNPQHFVVDRAATGAVVAGAAPPSRGDGSSAYGAGPYAHVLYGGSYDNRYGYSRYGNYYGAGIMPYGGRWGWGPGYYYQPTVIVVDRQPPAPRGQRVRGQGYRAGDGAQPPSRSGRPSEAGPDRRGSSSGGASAAPSTGSSAPPARTAQPRPPGGG